MPIFCLLLMTALAGLSGCAAQPRGHSTAAQMWAQKRGGLVVDGALQRVERVSLPLLQSVQSTSRKIRLHVIACESLTAYAWPSGEIYVSRGLVAALSDEELAAAVAHEMGHLVGDGHVCAVVALDGQANDHAHDHERQADATGCRIMSQSGLPPVAMSRMLQKVHDAQPAGSPLRSHLQARINALPR